MSRIELSGSIGSLLGFYKHERNIFGRCPHCDEPFRLSEVKLTYGKEPPRDLLAGMKKERDKIEEEMHALEAQIEELETEHGYEMEALETKWQDKIDIEVDRQIR